MYSSLPAGSQELHIKVMKGTKKWHWFMVSRNEAVWIPSPPFRTRRGAQRVAAKFAKYNKMRMVVEP